MRIISRRRLREFWTAHPESMPPLDRWYRIVRHARWQSFAELRRTYASADRAGNYVVFNVGGNKYRVVAAVHFNTQRVYVRHVLTHAEYDEGGWNDG